VSATAAITNPAYIDAVTGSDPTAYALLHPSLDGSQVIFPALAGPEQQDLHQKRLGLTSAYQWDISSRTRLTIDGLYSNQKSTSTLNQLLPFGLNRNNTNATYATASAATALASKRGLYPGTCTYTAGGAFASPIDCGQATYGGALVAGSSFSYNPNNLDVYDYYNWAGLARLCRLGRRPGHARQADRPSGDRRAGRQCHQRGRRLPAAAQSRLGGPRRSGQLRHHLQAGFRST
jgi:iron complex outermembrane receptor protein